MTKSKKFRKREVEKYEWTIRYIREEMKTGRDFWASLGSAGLTFISDIKRFCRYTSQVGAYDLREMMLMEHPDWEKEK